MPHYPDRELVLMSTNVTWGSMAAAVLTAQTETSNTFEFRSSGGGFIQFMLVVNHSLRSISFINTS